MVSVNIRPLFAILIAATMIIAPFAMRSGAAMAASPGSHHAEETGQDHCDPQQGEHHGETAIDENCCPATCGNFALPPAAAVDPADFSRGTDLSSMAAIGKSFLAKLPTPPPRVA